MTSNCGLCLKAITDQTALVQTGAACKHYFHDTCVKIRYYLPSKSRTAGKINNTCPVCFVDVSNVLESIHAKLATMDSIDQKMDTFMKTVNSMSTQVNKLI